MTAQLETRPTTRTYDEAQEIARVMWNNSQSSTACYVQKVSDIEWRVSDRFGSIQGYINIETTEVIAYGR